MSDLPNTVTAIEVDLADQEKLVDALKDVDVVMHVSFKSSIRNKDWLIDQVP